MKGPAAKLGARVLSQLGRLAAGSGGFQDQGIHSGPPGGMRPSPPGPGAHTDLPLGVRLKARAATPKAACHAGQWRVMGSGNPQAHHLPASADKPINYAWLYQHSGKALSPPLGAPGREPLSRDEHRPAKGGWGSAWAIWTVNTSQGAVAPQTQRPHGRCSPRRGGLGPGPWWILESFEVLL